MVDPNNTAPFYEQVKDDLKMKMRQGTFSPGKPLPSIAKLGKHYKVSNITVRKAVDRLVQEELVFTRKGVGAFVKPILPQTRIRVFVPEGILLEGLPQISTFSLLDNYAGIRREAGNSRCIVITVGAGSRLLYNPPRGTVREGCIFLHENAFIDQLDELDRRNAPYVVAEGLSEKYNSVRIDMEQGAHDATRYLIQLGHRRIGLLKGPGPWYVPRLAGYQKALRENDIPFEPGLVKECREDNIEEVGHCVDELLRQLPTAIFAANDYRALRTLEHLQRKGITVPDEISLIGYDNIPESSECTPALSTVNAPREQVGEESVKLLLSIFDGRTKTFPAKVTLNPSIVIRETTAPHEASATSSMETRTAG